MSRKLTTDTDLTAIADAIRAKGGTSAPLVYPTEFVSAIEAIELGINTSDANATANDVLSGKTAYVDGSKVTGNIPSKSSSDLTVLGATVTVPSGYYASQASKSVANGNVTLNTSSIDSNGLITSTTTVEAGYVAAATYNRYLQLATYAAQTIIPGTTNRTLTAGKYLSGTQTIAGDSNLVAKNIAKGVSIFGVTGTYSGSSNGSASANAVNFRDYDGTIVQSYSAADFAALTAMPNNPSHDGLTAQGWNWTLANAKAYVAKYGRLEIGQMYITDDGKTRIYIHLEQGRTSPMLGVCPDGKVDIDWGDDTAHIKLTGTSTSTVKWTSNHTYAAPGDYVIKLTVTGSMGFYGLNSSNQSSGLLRYTSSGDNRNRVYQNAIQRVEIGSGVTSIDSNAFYNCENLTNITIPNSVISIGSSAFYTCFSLTNITIPNNVISIGSSAFYSCYNLANITIPNSVTSIDGSAFFSCYGLTNITIPDSITSIGNNTFVSCYSLANITIPDSITSIGNNTFQYCYSIAEYHLTSTTPPTLSNTNIFNNISADCIIYVPYSTNHSILETYKTASNWSTYADYMQEELQ